LEKKCEGCGKMTVAYKKIPLFEGVVDLIICLSCYEKVVPGLVELKFSENEKGFDYELFRALAQRYGEYLKKCLIKYLMEETK